jgi:hypothetical protein
VGGMTIATWPNKDLTETEDESMCVCLHWPQGGEKNGQRCRRKEDRKGHGARVVVFLTPTFSRLPRTMPFVEVAVGMRDALRAILNHSFSPHLASTDLHCLVADVPLALRNHIFVPASFGERGVDEYQEIDEMAAHWTNVETLQNHCKVYGLAQEGAITELQERIQRGMDNLLVTADIDWRFPSNEATASHTFGDENPNMALNLQALNAKIIELDATASSVLLGQEGPQLPACDTRIRVSQAAAINSLRMANALLAPR